MVKRLIIAIIVFVLIMLGVFWIQGNFNQESQSTVVQNPPPQQVQKNPPVLPPELDARNKNQIRKFRDNNDDSLSDTPDKMLSRQFSDIYEQEDDEFLNDIEEFFRAFPFQSPNNIGIHEFARTIDKDKANSVLKKWNLQENEIIKYDLCKKNYGQSCYDLAMSLKSHLNHKFDEAIAILFDEACALNYYPSCAQLSSEIINNKSVIHDTKKAFAMAIKACEQKNPLGCATLARIYQNGIYVDPNNSLAAEYYAQACRYGDKTSCLGQIKSK